MIYVNEQGSELNLKSREDVYKMVSDMFSEVDTEVKCINTFVNIRSILDKVYNKKLEELRSK